MLNRSPIIDPISSFHEQARKGQIMKEVSPGKFAPMDRFSVNTSLFDFGHFLDENDSAWFLRGGDNDYWKQLIHQPFNALSEQILSLPFPRCGFLFRWHGTSSTPRSARLSIFEQNGGVITGDTFELRPDELQGRWLRFPVSFTLMDWGRDMAHAFDHLQARSRINQSKHHVMNMLVANAFLQRRGDIVDGDEPGAASVNAGRAKAGLPPMSIKIVSGRNIVRRADLGATGTGTQKSPHDRISHPRVLANGKTIMVKASAIHGGAGKARNYTVVS